MELVSIFLSVIIQVMKDKYHMILPRREPNLQNKQRRKTEPDMEIRNKLTVTGGKERGDNREKRGRVYSSTMYKGPMVINTWVGTQ